jgi:hypothetical protein
LRIGVLRVSRSGERLHQRDALDWARRDPLQPDRRLGVIPRPRTLAAAVCGLSATSAALAQSSNLQLYGRANLGLDNYGADGARDATATGANCTAGTAGCTPGSQINRDGRFRVFDNSSRVGLRGTEDLGNGLKAIFQIETGVNVDNGSNTGQGGQGNGSTGFWASRDSYVGLDSNFGRLTFGRQSIYYANGANAQFAANYINTEVPWTDGRAFGRIRVPGTRQSNVVMYTSPTFAGLNASGYHSPNAQEAVQTSTASDTNGNIWGATAEVIANTVAAPIEAQINGIDNLLYFNSVSSSSGNLSISVVFAPGSNPDINQVNVQNWVSQALPLIPQVASQQGVTVEKKSSSIMMVLSVFSPDERYSSTYIDNYANLYVLEELKGVPGANRAQVFGLPDIAMRVWLRPDRMAQLGISVQEVTAAIQSQNQTFGIGQIGAEPAPPGVQQTYVVTAQGLLTKPEEFENIIVRAAREGTAIVRVRDIGRVELAKRDYSIASRMNGKTATTIGIYQQPGANAVQTAGAVRARMEELKKQFPTGLDYKITLDTSLFTLNSIDKVVHTFFEAVVLVILVVFLFLQSLRATIIPILAVPVSIVGTFIGMHLLGFSINMLTMFGLILAKREGD